MPITSPSSFIATTNEFVAHWESVNADLGPGNEVTVTQGRGLGDLVAWRDELVAQRDALEGALNGVSIASGSIRDRKRGLLTRFGQLAAQMQARYGESVYAAPLPSKPRINDNENKFTQPMREAANVWAQLEGDGGSIVLAGAYGNVC